MRNRIKIEKGRCSSYIGPPNLAQRASLMKEVNGSYYFADGQVWTPWTAGTTNDYNASTRNLRVFSFYNVSCTVFTFWCCLAADCILESVCEHCFVYFCCVSHSEVFYYWMSRTSFHVIYICSVCSVDCL